MKDKTVQRLIAFGGFLACAAGAVWHEQLGISHGATVAFIVGAVLCFFGMCD
jgi:hypothetical protein